MELFDIIIIFKVLSTIPLVLNNNQKYYKITERARKL